MEPISYFQAIVLGALQGIAEPFPISSLGHAVIAPKLFGWNIHQNDEFFLAFLVATHCATALVLFAFFWQDWKRIIAGFVRSVRGQATPEDHDARLAWVMVIGTIPAGILGLALEHKLRTLFASPISASIFLTVNGILLLMFERLRRRPPRPGDYEGDADPRIARMSFKQAFAIGTAQAAALIPGISRSGVTMGGGLMTGLSNEDAARYAFLLATPIIGAAGVLKLPDLMGSARRRPRPGAGRGDRRRSHHLGRGQVPAPLLRDQPPQPLRRLLHRDGPLLHRRLLSIKVSSLTS